MRKNWLVGKILMLVFFITFQLIICHAGKSDLPEAPKGYSWKTCGNMQASFLLPDGWFFKEEEKDGTQAAFITKESPDKVKIYKTGFLVNVIKNCFEKTGKTPSVYAKQWIDEMAAKMESSNLGEVGDDTYFKGYNGYFRSTSPEGEKIVQFALGLGNDKTGTLYLCVFESPEAEWKSTWPIGTTIVDNLALETEF